MAMTSIYPILNQAFSNNRTVIFVLMKSTEAGEARREVD